MAASPKTSLYGDIKVFTGSATPELAQKIADYLGVELSGRDLIEFPNENLLVRLHGSVRGQDVYVIQSTSRPVHRNWMELFIMLQTLRLDSAARITAVIPFMSYARSDKKDQPRVPIVARLVADMVQASGADRYITLDLHAGQIQGFFSIPGDVLTTFHMLAEHARKLCKSLNDPVVIAGGHAAYNPEPMADFLDAVVIDEVDSPLAPGIQALETPAGRPPLAVAVTDTIMVSMEKKAALARTALRAAGANV